jgi:hypothetical protein
MPFKVASRPSNCPSPPFGVVHRSSELRCNALEFYQSNSRCSKAQIGYWFNPVNPTGFCHPKKNMKTHNRLLRLLQCTCVGGDGLIRSCRINASRVVVCDTIEVNKQRRHKETTSDKYGWSVPTRRHYINNMLRLELSSTSHDNQGMFVYTVCNETSLVIDGVGQTACWRRVVDGPLKLLIRPSWQLLAQLLSSLAAAGNWVRWCVVAWRIWHNALIL